MWYGYTCLFVVLPIVFSFLCWIVSLSFGFGFILFFPLAAFNALCYFFTFGTLWAIERFTKQQKAAAENKGTAKEDDNRVMTSAGLKNKKELRRLSSNHAFENMVTSIDIWVHDDDALDDEKDHNHFWMSDKSPRKAQEYAENTDKYLKKKSETIHSMVWWVADLKVPIPVYEILHAFFEKSLESIGLAPDGAFHWLVPQKDEANNFKSTIQWATVFLVLAPFVVFGTWAAAFAYEERRSPTQVGALIRLIYNFVFSGFRGKVIQLPSFTFDISSISKAYKHFKEMEFEFTLFTPADYLATSSGLTALNFAISIPR